MWIHIENVQKLIPLTSEMDDLKGLGFVLVHWFVNHGSQCVYDFVYIGASERLFGSVAPLLPVFVSVSAASVALFRVSFAVLVDFDRMHLAVTISESQQPTLLLHHWKGWGGMWRENIKKYSYYYCYVTIIIVVIISRDIQKKLTFYFLIFKVSFYFLLKANMD